jgi:hypothetical protein
MSECHFESGPLYCVECGGMTNEMGTCRDLVYCQTCRQSLLADDSEGYLTFIALAEETPYIGTSEEVPL